MKRFENHRSGLREFFAKNSATIFGRQFEKSQIKLENFNGFKFKSGDSIFTFSFDEEMTGYNDRNQIESFKQDVVRHSYVDPRDGKRKSMIYPITDQNFPRIENFLSQQLSQNGCKGFKFDPEVLNANKENNRSLGLENAQRNANRQTLEQKQQDWDSVIKKSFLGADGFREKTVGFNFKGNRFVFDNKAKEFSVRNGSGAIIEKYSASQDGSAQALQKCLGYLQSKPDFAAFQHFNVTSNPQANKGRPSGSTLLRSVVGGSAIQVGSSSRHGGFQAGD